MAHVTLWGSLKPLAGGEGELELDARNIRDLLARLTERHPGLQPALDRGISISSMPSLSLPGKRPGCWPPWPANVRSPQT